MHRDRESERERQKRRDSPSTASRRLSTFFNDPRARAPGALFCRNILCQHSNMENERETLKKCGEEEKFGHMSSPRLFFFLRFAVWSQSLVVSVCVEDDATGGVSGARLFTLFLFSSLMYLKISVRNVVYVCFLFFIYGPPSFLHFWFLNISMVTVCVCTLLLESKLHIFG